MIFCKDCGSDKIENRDLLLCASCARMRRKAAKVEPSDNHTAINKMSVKTSQINSRYVAKLKVWKKGKKCQAQFKHDCSGDITCHHMAGRGNHFYDEHAEEKGIPLTLDDRFWMPICTVAHDYITENSKFAWDNGYSFKRVADKMFHKQ